MKIKHQNKFKIENQQSTIQFNKREAICLVKNMKDILFCWAGLDQPIIYIHVLY